MNSVIVHVAPEYTMERLAGPLSQTMTVHGSAQDGRLRVDTNDDHVYLQMESDLVDEYDDDEVQLIRSYLPVSSTISVEYRSAATARRVLEAMLPGVQCLVDDNRGAIQTGLAILERLAVKGDDWLAT